MTTDKNGQVLKIGDRIRYEGYNSYEFTITEFHGGLVWGEDMPENMKYYDRNLGFGEPETRKNGHNPNAGVYVPPPIPPTSHDGNILKHKFIYE